MMGEEDRLGAAEVLVAREDGVGMPPPEDDDRALEAIERRVDARARGPEPEAQVERHLVVPAPPGVELPAERAEDLGQPALDRHVDVFVRREEAEAARIQLPPN